jgi:hypothetical protein
MTLHMLYGITNLSGKVRFKQLGLVLLAESILFGTLLGVLS